jgi:hypothetical protein
MLSAKRCDGLRRNLINKEIQGRGRQAARQGARINFGENANLSFLKIRSGRIRAVRKNQTIIQFDVCDHLPAWNIYRRSAQVAAPA